MKHKTWFRLVLKAIGIFLLATGVAGLLSSISGAYGQRLVYDMFGAGRFASFEQFLSFVLSFGLIDGIVRLGIGAYLLFGGAKLVDLCIPSNRPYCPHCGYDLRSVGDDDVCPECGVRLPADLLAAPQGEAGADLTESDE